MQPHETEASVLRVPARDIHRLDPVAGRSLHEVVDRTERDDPFAARIEGEPDVGEVRPREELRLWVPPDARALFHDAYERLGRVGVAVDLPERLLVERGGRVDVRGREHAPDKLHRGHGEIHAQVVPTEAQLLLDLRRVAVPDRPKGSHHARALRMVAVLARFAPALARADLALDDDRPTSVHHAGTEERQERDDGRGRVAARASDPLAVSDLISVKLGHAVDPAVENGWPGMRRAVPAVVVGRVP